MKQTIIILIGLFLIGCTDVTDPTYRAPDPIQVKTIINTGTTDFSYKVDYIDTQITNNFYTNEQVFGRGFVSFNIDYSSGSHCISNSLLFEVYTNGVLAISTNLNDTNYSYFGYVKNY